MVSHAFAALAKKRTDLAEKEKGFTLIELLVVVIIIGVLAAIAIPVYLNVQNSAKDSAVQSDLTNAKTAVISAQTTSTGGAVLPANQTAFNTASPAPAGSNYASGFTALTYITNATTDFCISATSASTKTYAIDAAGSVKEGTCNTTTFKVTP